MAGDLNVALRIKALNQTASGIRGVQSQTRRLKKTFDQMNRSEKLAHVKKRVQLREERRELEKIAKAQLGIKKSRSSGGNFFRGANLAQIGGGLNQISDSLGRVNRMVLTDSISAFNDFDEAMAAVTAKGGKELIDQQRDLARQLGRDTRFSAVEAAGGLEFLAQAGFSAQDRMKALPPMLDLATASGSDLIRTADIASNIMTGFGIEAGKAATVADLLTVSVNKSNVNLEELGQAMANVAPLAKSLGVDMKRTAAFVGVLGDRGIKAGKAGTALKIALTRLSAPNKRAAKQLKKLGLGKDFIQANIDTPEVIFRELNKGLADKNATERASAIKDIFGEEAQSSISAILSGVAATDATGFDQKMIDLRNREKAAADGAAEKTKTLAASMERLKNAGNDLQLTFAEILAPDTKELADQISEDVVPPIQSWLKENPRLAKGIAIGSLGLQGLTRVSGGLFNAMSGAHGAIGVMKETGMTGQWLATKLSTTLPPAMRAVGAAAGVAAAAFIGWQIGTWIDDMTGASDKIADFAASIGGLNRELGLYDKRVTKRGAGKVTNAKGLAAHTVAATLRAQQMAGVDLYARRKNLQSTLSYQQQKYEQSRAGAEMFTQNRRIQDFIVGGAAQKGQIGQTQGEIDRLNALIYARSKGAKAGEEKAFVQAQYAQLIKSIEQGIRSGMSGASVEVREDTGRAVS